MEMRQAILANDLAALLRVTAPALGCHALAPRGRGGARLVDVREGAASASSTRPQQRSSAELEGCGRLVEPVLFSRETGRNTPLSWDDAMERITNKLRSTPADDTFWYSSGRSSNEAGFLLQLSARLYMPPGYDRAKGPLPMLFWAYPTAFKSPAAASRVEASP